MQPEAIPFDTNRQSFAFVIVLMIAIVYVSRLVIRYIPTFQKRIALWFKNRRLDETIVESSAHEHRGGLTADDIGMEEDMVGLPV